MMMIRLPARIFFVVSVAAVVSILTLVQLQQSSNIVLSLSSSATPASATSATAVDYATIRTSRETNRHRRIHRNILEYVDTNPETSCPNGLYLVNDTRLDNLHYDNLNSDSSTLLSSSKLSAEKIIPKIIHITSKSRCMTKEFSSNIDKWRLPGYSVLIHNDDAVDKLLNSYFPEFPELYKVVHCLVSGAGKADLWRAVVLWEYGGIYTDMDNIPNSTNFLNGTIINHQADDSWFVVEQGGWLSQYFMVSTSHHPLMYFVIHKIIQRVYSLNDVDTQYVPRSTGPGALKYGFINFMNDQGPNIYEGFGNCNSKYKYQYGTVIEGKYVGFHNRTVTVRGNRKNSQEYIIRENFKTKKSMYNEMNMTHFSDYEKQQKKKKQKKQQQQQQQDIESCFRRIYQSDPWLSSLSS